MKSKIIETKINNPDASSRDIAKGLWSVVSNDTVCDVLNNDLPQVATESRRIADLIDTNNKLQTLADILIASKLENKEENVRISELVSLRESTFKQNQIIQNKPTENIGFLEMSEEQKKTIALRYQNND